MWYARGMSTVELIKEIEALTLPEKRLVRKYIRSLLLSREATVSFGLPKYSVDDVLSFADKSDLEHRQGKTIPYKEAIEEVRKKYEIPA